MFVRRNQWMRRVLFTVVILWSMTTAAGRAQTAYTYTVIADLANCDQFATPAINNKGEVAFGAHCGPPIGPLESSIVIRRGDGGALTPIYTWSTSSGTQNVPQMDFLSINDSGMVAFAVNGPCPNGGAAAIWTGDGGPTNTVYDICTNPGFTSVLRPSISNAGAVTFMAASGNGYDTVLRVSSGASVTIAGPGTVTSVGALSGAIEPSINNNGVVTFTGQGQLNFGLFTGTGGALTTISLDGPSTFNGINDSGRVGFVANNIAVQTGDGGPVTTIATRTFEGGMYDAFPGGGAAINNTGKVAFMAYLPSPPGTQGVFTGPDPNFDLVLKTGDFMPGFGTVTSAFILREAINDSGQIAMAVTFNDAGTPRAAIIRADPPNSPPTASDGTATVTAGASVSGTLNATDPDNEPLTYALVANGTNGTAVIDDASTGAFTYTANAGTSGNDTFTFQVTDIRGLASNVASVTIGIQPIAPTCAVNVTSSIGTVKGKASKNTSTTQRLSLRNDSAAITGPISLAVDLLSPAGTTLVNAVGVTACVQPAGSPYVNVDVGADSIWSTGEVVEVILEFALPSSGPGKKPAITYTRRILAGAGAR